jgi:hypothetical protein
MKILLSLLLLLLVSCRTPYDTSPAPINHNLMTQELSSCDQREVGLLGCFYDIKKNGILSVPLWHRGEWQIKSERCRYIANKRYEGTQKLEISYEELLAGKPDTDDTCLYNVKVFIDGFDNGFEGFFLLSKGDIKAAEFSFMGRSFTGYAGLQIRESVLVPDRLSFVASTPGEIVWEGCQLKGDRRYEKDPQINFQEVIGGSPIPAASCVLTVGLIPDNESLPVELAKVQINIYEKTVVPLPQPALEYEHGELKVTSDKLTAAIGINDKFSIQKGNGKKVLKADVPVDEEVDVRIATSNGRFMLLRVKNGVVLWIK